MIASGAIAERDSRLRCGSVNVEGERTTLPAHTDCATGGFRAIAAFKTLSPSYSGQVERND
jgi:hypothetical protein